jgi:hypothetical protein
MGGLLKWKAEQSKHKAIGKKQRDTHDWPVLANSTSRALRAKGLQSDLLAWPRIWSVLGVSEFVDTSYTENRKACGGAMIIDANVLRGLADECVAAAAVVLVDPRSALSRCT